MKDEIVLTIKAEVDGLEAVLVEHQLDQNSLRQERRWNEGFTGNDDHTIYSPAPGTYQYEFIVKTSEKIYTGYTLKITVP